MNIMLNVIDYDRESCTLSDVHRRGGHPYEWPGNQAHHSHLGTGQAIVNLQSSTGLPNVNMYVEKRLFLL